MFSWKQVMVTLSVQSAYSLTTETGTRPNIARLLTGLMFKKAWNSQMPTALLPLTVVTPGPTLLAAERERSTSAASTRESPSYSGARAYSKLLKNKLETMSLPFSVEELYDDMLSASRLRPINKNGGTLLATPDHGWAGNSLKQSIRLQPLSASDTDAPITSEGSSTVRYIRYRYYISNANLEHCRIHCEALLA